MRRRRNQRTRPFRVPLDTDNVQELHEKFIAALDDVILSGQYDIGTIVGAFSLTAVDLSAKLQPMIRTMDMAESMRSTINRRFDELKSGKIEIVEDNQ